MKIRTSRVLVSALRGSAFRRVTCDSRCWAIREIRTLRSLGRKGRHPVSPAQAVVRVGTGRPYQ